LVVEPGEVRVERLRDGAVRVRLDLVRERLVLLIATAQRIFGVDRDLPFEAADFAQRLRRHAARNGDENDVGVRYVTALAAEHRDAVARLLPEPAEPPANIAFADRGDIHGFRNARQPRTIPTCPATTRPHSSSPATLRSAPSRSLEAGPGARNSPSSSTSTPAGR